MCIFMWWKHFDKISHKISTEMGNESGREWVWERKLISNVYKKNYLGMVSRFNRIRVIEKGRGCNVRVRPNVTSNSASAIAVGFAMYPFAIKKFHISSFFTLCGLKTTKLWNETKRNEIKWNERVKSKEQSKRERERGGEREKYSLTPLQMVNKVLRHKP